MILGGDESDEAGTGDKAEGTSGDVDIGRIGQDTSPALHRYITPPQ
jgi:hypothetical protein